MKKKLYFGGWNHEYYYGYCRCYNREIRPDRHWCDVFASCGDGRLRRNGSVKQINTLWWSSKRRVVCSGFPFLVIFYMLLNRKEGSNVWMWYDWGLYRYLAWDCWSINILRQHGSFISVWTDYRCHNPDSASQPKKKEKGLKQAPFFYIWLIFTASLME